MRVDREARLGATEDDTGFRWTGVMANDIFSLLASYPSGHKTLDSCGEDFVDQHIDWFEDRESKPLIVQLDVI